MREPRGADDYDNEVGETEDEKARQWDEKQADLELKRAARSAETCPGSVTEKSPIGTANVTLVFQNDGHVKSSDIAPPYAETAVGACVLRAMGAVIVPAYQGDEKTVTWEIELKEPPKEKGAEVLATPSGSRWSTAVACRELRGTSSRRRPAPTGSPRSRWRRLPTGSSAGRSSGARWRRAA